MSRTSRVLRCSPEAVFDILNDGWSYANWVVGAARIRAVDETWPEPGSRIHHSVGAWPLMISDHTEVVEVDSPQRIVLEVRAWPSGMGVVDITVSPHDDGAEVVLSEQATSGPVSVLPKPLQDLVLHPRNVETLRRLSFLAEGRAGYRGDSD